MVMRSASARLPRSAAKRASDYVEANDGRLDLRVHGLQCRFCIAFGREEKVGAKRKPSSDVQGWIRPFRYDNIENHVAGQHPQKWAEYNLLNSAADRNAFFDDVPVAFKNSIKAHFPSLSLDAERQMVFDVADSDSESDAEELAFGSEAERNAVLRRRAKKTALAEERAVALFKRVDGNGDADYSYSVTIPSQKPLYSSLRYDTWHAALPFDWQPTY
ncbi:hypothetical protein PBRA_006648 [Plasmodiophora brassicae]|uniref:Uncharacterized protein n=1 Tax=Plasmodiophora brassicae TaxID=37360 RepID=A0A0G4ITN0_PLABS|nr:hypothetical protein PBRA_006648 [Plasmodiophora brassicae]